MIAVPNGVIFEHELARERRVGVERHRSGLRQLRVRERPDGGCRSQAVLLQQCDGGFPCDVGVLRCMTRVHLVDSGHRDAGDGLAVRNGHRELNLERVHAGDMMHDDAHRAPVVWNASLPFRVGERGREGSEGLNSLFETIGQRVGELAAGTCGRACLR